MLKIKTFVLGPIETNCYLAYDDNAKEAILVDPAVYDEKIAGFIRSNNIGVKYIVNTHGHYDHIGGDRDFGYTVLIHEKDKKCFKNPSRSLFFLGGFSSAPKDCRTLKDKDVIAVREASFKVIHTPGHTPGGITLECGNILFTGDTLFCEGVGRTDLPFASYNDLKESVKKLMSYSDETVIYPGHGPSSTIGHERRHNQFVNN